MFAQLRNPHYKSKLRPFFPFNFINSAMFKHWQCLNWDNYNRTRLRQLTFCTDFVWVLLNLRWCLEINSRFIKLLFENKQKINFHLNKSGLGVRNTLLIIEIKLFVWLCVVSKDLIQNKFAYFDKISSKLILIMCKEIAYWNFKE